jgi:uncharacterized repeat protein (TIGR01451 family)
LPLDMRADDTFDGTDRRKDAGDRRLDKELSEGGLHAPSLRDCTRTGMHYQRNSGSYTAADWPHGEYMRRTVTYHTHALGRPKWSHKWILSVVLGLLGVCIVFVTAHAYVIRRFETTLNDFYTGTFLYTGLLDIPEEDIDSVQLLPVGLTGDWQTSVHHLPQELADLAAVANGEWIYTLGGTIDQNTDRVRREVYVAQMKQEGDTTTWEVETPLPEPRAGASALAYDLGGGTSVLYAIGGFDGSYASVDTIYRATVDNETGELGDWMGAGQTLPIPAHYASAVEHDSNLYVIGGLHRSAARTSEPSNRVYYYPINADGSLGTLVETAPLPNPTYNSYAIVYQGELTDTLYVIGGVAVEASSPEPTYQVYFADFLEGGGITPWSPSDGRLPVPQWGHGGALINGGEILLTGGFADPVNPMTGISSTVKSALVDVDNPSFRLYDWCLGVDPPACTIGAWQTGELLPDVRALHGTVAGRTHIYVIGGLDGSAHPKDTVYFGSVTGQGALYSPDGIYRSKEMYLGPYSATLRKMAWDVTYGYPDQMSISMQYRTSGDGDHWSAWSEPVMSVHGWNEHEPLSPPSGFRYIQYQANMNTTVDTASPLLNEVEVYYEVADPDLSVIKDTGMVISAALGSELQYNIHYTNTGHWQADKAYLTEVVPDHASYAGDGSWHQVGSSDVYTYALGTVPAGDTGSVPFKIRVDQQVPPETYRITNTVEVDYPPMVDAFDQTIVDPAPEDNLYQLGTPLNIFALQFAKRADPPAGTVVTPGSYITYTIVYTNAGLRAVSQAVITDTFDPQGDYTVISANPPPDQDGHVWNLGMLDGSQTGQIEIVVQLDEPMPNNWPVTNEASMSSLEGGLLGTPVLTHTVMNLDGTEPASMVDFVVEGITWEPAEPRATSDVSFYATLTNQGTADAPEPFWVALYIKPQPSGAPQSPSDHDRGYCLYNCATLRPSYLSYVPQLDAGSSTQLAFENLEPDPGFPAVDCFDVYIQADVAFDSADYNFYWGLYAEGDETNNILHQTICIEEGPVDDGPPRVFLPIISRNGH